jgi:Holliday junction resolvasome RuvABC endonuclease subunit
MKGTHLIKILAFDVSYRSTGWAQITLEDNDIFDITHGLIDNDKTEYHSFHQYAKYAKYARKTANKIYEIESIEMPQVVLYEMPYITQSAMSSVLIGMLWGAINKRWNGYFVEPGLIKEWSESKRGDGKKQVRSKVKEYLGYLPSKNNNIIDAIANCLMFKDVLTAVKINKQNNVEEN